MPSSWTGFKSNIQDWIINNVPTNKRVLDVGPGVGTYSDLLRHKGYQIDAVEIFRPYIEKYELIEKYDNVYCDDIVKFDISDYDFIILGDVLEHLPAERAKELVDKIIKLGKECLVAVPYMMEQGEYQGNIHETHYQPDLTFDIMKERYPKLELPQNWHFYGK